MKVSVIFDNAGVKVEPQALAGYERLGQCSTFDLELVASDPVAPADVLHKTCAIVLEGEFGARTIQGVVTRFVVVATSRLAQRVYRTTIRSTFALLELRRWSHIFQNMTVPDIVEEVAKKGGFKAVHKHVGDHPKRRYVVQYDETDAQFVRRLCEEEGLFFHFAPSEAGEVFVLADKSAKASKLYADGIVVAHETKLLADRPSAIRSRKARRARPGKVTLHDYNLENPKMTLEGVAAVEPDPKADGNGKSKPKPDVCFGEKPEADVEVYDGHGRFKTSKDGSRRAQLRLEVERSEAALVMFESNAFALHPGVRTKLVSADNYIGRLALAGKYFVVAVATRWDNNTLQEARAEVEVIPRDVPYRLPRVTPRPRLPGVQSAFVSGAEGHEIHPDEYGRVHLKFHWDVHGPSDHQSSVPARTAQPHTPGSMIIPRVGWEVFVMFEDGDPDRPYVLGRSFNGKQPPPLSLPANKTVSSIATDSSPGAPARALLQYDDAKAREHMRWHSPFFRRRKSAKAMSTKTKKNENYALGGNLTTSTGSDETISVKLAWMQDYGSQDLSVTGMQYQFAAGKFVTAVGAEKVMVLALVGEQVGNPVKGLANLIVSAALAGVSSMGIAGAIAGGALGIAKATGEGFLGADAGSALWKTMTGQKLSASEAGASKSFFGAALGTAMSVVPGGEAITSYVTGSSKPMPWDHGQPPLGPVTPGGGGQGTSGGDGGPTGPGPGYRTTVADSSYIELVGAAYAVATPGSISWVTNAAAAFMIRGNHKTDTRKGNVLVLGGLGEFIGPLNVDSKGVIQKKVLGLLKHTTDGAVNVEAKGEYKIVAKTSLKMNVTGDLTFSGNPITFKCGSSYVLATGSMVEISAGSITFKGDNTQTGALVIR
jgi:type VI secretion system secreted protein VgrG